MLIDNRHIKNRKSIRLKEYDYSLPNWYYVTINTFMNECLFGEIENGYISLNEFGMIAQEEWFKTKQIRKNVDLDYYQIMPNHIHGIIIIDYQIRKGELQFAPTNKFISPSNSVGAIIRGFKSAVTTRINSIKQTKRKPFWQRNYFEHIIRTEKDLEKIRKYIINNPLKWYLDKDNPENWST
jgi:REP element-mobilizing transposase RayT